MQMDLPNATLIMFGSSVISSLPAARMTHLHEDPSKRTPGWLMPRLYLRDGAIAREDGGATDPRDYPGEKYLGAFEETLRVLGEWMQENV